MDGRISVWKRDGMLWRYDADGKRTPATIECVREYSLWSTWREVADLEDWRNWEESQS